MASAQFGRMRASSIITIFADDYYFRCLRKMARQAMHEDAPLNIIQAFHFAGRYIALSPHGVHRNASHFMPPWRHSSKRATARNISCLSRYYCFCFGASLPSRFGQLYIGLKALYNNTYAYRNAHSHEKAPLSNTHAALAQGRHCAASSACKISPRWLSLRACQRRR